MRTFLNNSWQITANDNQFDEVDESLTGIKFKSRVSITHLSRDQDSRIDKSYAKTS